MQTYRRFVSYVYQYENGKKSGNRGFIKVEARGNTCSLQISLKGVCRDGNGSCRIYGFKREEGLLKGSLLAECPVKTGLVQEQLVFLRNEMGEGGYSLHDLSGVILRGDDGTMYGTQWDDAPMKMENFQPDERQSKGRPAQADTDVKEPGGAQGEEVREEEPEPQGAMEIIEETRDLGAAEEEEIDGSKDEGEESPAVMQGEDEMAVLQTATEPEIQEEEEPKEQRGAEPGADPSVEIQEEKQMPPKVPEVPAVDGAGSERSEGFFAELSEGEKGEKGENVPADPPEGEDIQETQEQQEPEEERAEEEQAAGEMGPWEEGAGLPEVLDTTVELPDLEAGEGAFQPLAEEELVEGAPAEEESIEDSGREEIIEGGAVGADDREGDGPDLAEHGEPEMEAENVREEAAPRKRTFCPFTDGILEDCRKISMEDIRSLDPRDQGLQNNRFVQHGYQMFGHLLLAKIARNSQYILGVPGMYQKQEKFMADMYGFHNFKCARKSGNRPACFGYWYRLIYPPKLRRGNGDAD